MKQVAYQVAAVAATVTAAFGAALVAESIVSPTVASLALVVTLFAATVTAWLEPRE
jgi:hypothetical protein